MSVVVVLCRQIFSAYIYWMPLGLFLEYSICFVGLPSQERISDGLLMCGGAIKFYTDCINLRWNRFIVRNVWNSS